MSVTLELPSRKWAGDDACVFRIVEGQRENLGKQTWYCANNKWTDFFTCVDTNCGGQGSAGVTENAEKGGLRKI